MATPTINHYFDPEIIPAMQSMFDLIEVSRRGLPKKVVATMARNLGIVQSDLVVLLHISARTWQRYDNEKLLPPEVTERALQIASLYKSGENVFGDPAKFDGWLKHPNPVFGDKKPVDLLDTQFGYKAVEDELVRIDWGVLA